MAMVAVAVSAADRLHGLHQAFSSSGKTYGSSVLFHLLSYKLLGHDYMKYCFPFSKPLIVLPTRSLIAPLKTPPPPQ